MWQTGALCPFVTLVSSHSRTGVKGLFKHKNPLELPWRALNISERGGGLSCRSSVLKTVHVQPHFIRSSTGICLSVLGQKESSKMNQDFGFKLEVVKEGKRSRRGDFWIPM